MPYDARAIANYFLELAKRSEESLDPLKLQKLVYLAHGWNLAIRDQPLITERVEAWPYGPVIPGVYHAFKMYGNGKIEEPATEWKFPDDSWFSVGWPETKKLSIDDEQDSEHNSFTKQLLERVWDAYNKFSGVQLSNMTHEPDSPWAKARKKSTGERGAVIGDDLIRTYFVAQTRQHEPVHA